MRRPLTLSIATPLLIAFCFKGGEVLSPALV
jgi:hypothetical protein